MKPAALILAGFFAWFSYSEMAYQDEIRQERAWCISGLELEFDMPAYCDKYENLGEVK